MADPNLQPDQPPQPAPSTQSYSLATRSVHADDALNHYTDVAPALHVSTTFRYSKTPTDLVPASESTFTNRFVPGHGFTADAHIYSRATAPNTSRLEALLTSLLGAPCITYSSGLAAFHALLVHLHPKVIAIGAGYHGCHGVLQVYQKLTNCTIVNLLDERSWSGEGFALGHGDLVHLETPVNPTGLAFDITKYAALAHGRGAKLSLDATFAPPPLLDGFAWGADYVMHSGTKYFGGHSDMLAGVIAIGKRDPGWEAAYWSMFGERMFLGAVLGNMEGWLGVRSLRTLELRVVRQSQSATRLVRFLAACLDGSEGGGEEDDEEEDGEGVDDETRTAVKKSVAKIYHASLQRDDMRWLKQQMPNGFGPVFSIDLQTATQAKTLPSRLHLFHHATSLGGVESLIEWRRMSDDTVQDTLCRVSIGVESFEDLRDDLVQAFKSLA